MSFDQWHKIRGKNVVHTENKIKKYHSFSDNIFIYLFSIKDKNLSRNVVGAGNQKQDFSLPAIYVVL